MLTDMKAFQAARSSAVVPAALANADTLLGDSLSAAMAADQELITGMDTNDDTKIKEGFKKVYAAMLTFAKAESAIAAPLTYPEMGTMVGDRRALAGIRSEVRIRPRPPRRPRLPQVAAAAAP